MKYLNNLKLVSSFREISQTLDYISAAIRVVSVLLLVLQAVLLFRDYRAAVKR
jgi:hypothetical protein